MTVGEIAITLILVCALAANLGFLAIWGEMLYEVRNTLREMQVREKP